MPPAASLATSLKKGEGEPLNRHDIQYSLLQKIFNDTTAVFTPRPGSVYDIPNNRVTFGDLYIDDFLASAKLSKTLKEKFINDPVVTRKVCMASLLVNTGRINTTLVFTPTQARTYNPIPSIQAYGSGHKMLQDAPRLKGILKGSCEDPTQSPPDWEILRTAQRSGAPKPLSNPINVVFLLSSSATTIDMAHFKDYAFLPHELLSDARFTSDSRARAFLWLMYFYLETDASLEEAQSNPFGASPGDYLVPHLETAADGELLAENVDLPVEVQYSTKMWEERKRYLALSAQKALEAATPGKPLTPALARTASDAKAQSRASSVTPSEQRLLLDDTVRRSSRKVKRKIYDSGPDLHFSEHEPEEADDGFVQLRTSQILRHRLRRSQHQSKKIRRSLSVIRRSWTSALDNDDLVWDDRDGEEAKTLARALRRAERRGKQRTEERDRKDVYTPAAHGNGVSKKSTGSGFKIKLKF